MEQENKDKKESASEQNIIRIFISKQSEVALNDITDAVNEGFDAGRVSRSDVANHMIMKFKNELSEPCIQLIRNEHFSLVTHMERLLKKIKNGEKVPQSIVDAISESYLGQAASPKKSKKNLNLEYSKDIPKESDAA